MTKMTRYASVGVIAALVVVAILVVGMLIV